MPSPEVALSRYSVTGRLDEHRLRGHDERLGRDVLLWVFATAEEAERERVVTLASSFARLKHPVFLQTLDLFEERGRVFLALEAPREVAPGTGHPLEHGLPALVAATLTLRIGVAIEEAAHAGLAVRDLQLEHVHLSGTDEVRLDPAGLLEPAERAASGVVSLLTWFLASFLPGGDRAEPARTRFDPGAEAAAGFVGRWQERAERGEADGAGDLSAFLDELRLIARSPTDLYIDDDAALRHRAEEGAAPLPVQADEEQTVPLALPPVRRVEAADEAAPRQEPERSSVGVLRERGRGSSRASAPRRPPRSPMLAIAGFGLVAALAVGLIAIGVRARGGGDGATVDRGAAASATPTPAPANRATLTITAQQDARVRISVDAAVAFAGVLRAGESGSWEGGSRVQVWTDNGKSISVTVNGFALGPLSPAVGHPEWNTVDWGWPAGWRPQ